MSLILILLNFKVGNISYYFLVILESLEKYHNNNNSNNNITIAACFALNDFNSADGMGFMEIHIHARLLNNCM